MEKVDVASIFAHSSGKFLLAKGQTYRIVSLGYGDVSNPKGDTVFDPMDITKIVINKTGEFEDGTEIYEVQNNCDCGVHIEILKQA